MANVLPSQLLTKAEVGQTVTPTTIIIFESGGKVYQGMASDVLALMNKDGIGLSNVDNLAPADLPISNAVQVELTRLESLVGLGMAMPAPAEW